MITEIEVFAILAQGLAAHMDMVIKVKAQAQKPSNWDPLVKLVGWRVPEQFMFMGDADNLNLYKHTKTRKYLNIDRVTGFTYRFIPAKDLDEAKAGKAHYEQISTFDAVTEAFS